MNLISWVLFLLWILHFLSETTGSNILFLVGVA